MDERWRRTLIGLLLCVISASAVGARGDAAGDRRRALLAPVRRVLVIPPYFATDTRQRGAPAATRSAGASADKVAAYAGQLERLEVYARGWLPGRLAVRTNWQLIPASEVEAALKARKLTLAGLFKGTGRMQGSRFPQPDPAAVHELATALHADAALLTAMDEPRRANGHYLFDPLMGLGYDAPKVSARVGCYLLMADGAEALHSYVEVFHPLSRLGGKEFLMADWEEAEEQWIESFLDELTRYTPPVPASPPAGSRGSETTSSVAPPPA